MICRDRNKNSHVHFKEFMASDYFFCSYSQNCENIPLKNLICLVKFLMFTVCGNTLLSSCNSAVVHVIFRMPSHFDCELKISNFGHDLK